MWLFSLLRNRTSHSPARGRLQRRATAPRFRPQLEVLEGRDVPSTLTVTSNLGFGPGSLRSEIYSAQNGDTIVFDKSLQGKTIFTFGNDGTPFEIEINKSVNIQGLGANHLAISGRYSSRVFRVDGIDLLFQPVHVTISGLTIENGGGIQGGFDGNDDDMEGGGIINYGTLTLTGCTLSGNSVTNVPGLGGAIYNAGTLTLSGCTVTGNSAQVQGGGIFNAGMLTLTGSTVTRNSAVSSYRAIEGGGIYNAGTLTLSGSTVSQNSGSGAGIYNDYSGVLTILSSTVKNNHGTFDLYNLGTWSADSSSTIGTVGP